MTGCKMISVLLLFLVGCYSPVRWTEHIVLDDLADIDAVLDERRPIPEDLRQRLVLRKYREGGGTIYAQANTGREYLRLLANDYYGHTTYDMACESFFIHDTVSLAHLSYARPSRESYVANLRFDQIDPGKLPASPFIWGPFPDRPIKTLAEFDPNFEVVSVTADSIVIIADNTKHCFDLQAWGDFDGDGIEDVLLSHAYYSQIGTARSYGHEFLTKRPGDGDLVSCEWQEVKKGRWYPGLFGGEARRSRVEEAKSRLCHASGNAGVPHALPIRWTEQLGFKPFHSLDLTGLGSSDWLSDGLLPRGASIKMVCDDKTVTVTSLQDYYDLMIDGLRPVMECNASFQANALFVRYVYPQFYLRQATPAERSYLTGFALSEDLLKDLPPLLGAFALPAEEFDRVDAIESAGGTWADIYPEDRVEVHSANHVTVTGRGGRVVIRQLAWGDFDGDGFEDILLWLWRETEGTYFDYDVIVLTRTAPGERLQAVDCEPALGLPATIPPDVGDRSAEEHDTLLVSPSDPEEGVCTGEPTVEEADNQIGPEEFERLINDLSVSDEEIKEAIQERGVTRETLERQLGMIFGEAVEERENTKQSNGPARRLITERDDSHEQE